MRRFKELAVYFFFGTASAVAVTSATTCLTGCASSPAVYEDQIARKIAAAKSAVFLFEIALAEAEKKCVDAPIDRESPCRAIPNARAALAKAKQAIALADANRGMLDSALTALEQVAEAVDMARGGATP